MYVYGRFNVRIQTGKQNSNIAISSFILKVGLSPSKKLFNYLLQ